MKRILFLTVTTLFTAGLQAQGIPLPSAAHVEAMKKVAFIEGNWKGTGWVQMGPQRHNFLQEETVALKVNGTILQIDGRGVDAEDPQRVIHMAFGVITYNTENNTYRMMAFRGDGAEVQAYLKPLSENSFEWGFKHPMAGDMRYIITVNNNEWIETGEMSRDGNQWLKFIEMRLKRQ